ncbi:hypothetical protein [Lysobacter tyrosinilyticus]
MPTETSGSRTSSSNKQQLALDNLIRRELRVGDPRNPEQIANALLDRYQYDRRAAAIQQEAQGLPFLRSPQSFAPAAPEQTATSIDLKQALSDIDKDLRQITSSNLLKDISAELDGWSDAIRTASDEGVNAARFGIDPRNRDRAFGIRRTLGDYARLSRLVGALTPAASYDFRSLAQSIDEVCAVILVMLGESMANNGFAGGRYLLQAPYPEMQTRRDACMHALQNLLSSLSYMQGPNEWPRGIDAYRRLFDALEAQGQGDLRALMTELELGRIMDNLVRRAAHGSSEGLRALGSTAQIDLNRFYRLVNFGYRLVDPESPPLTGFLESLRLFADGFGPAGGSRLLRVARPPIVFYGLYGSEEEKPSDRRLVQMTITRGRLASQLDCCARCCCDGSSVIKQILLDKVLYDVDRAIDLYAVGQQDLNLPELRASAYSYTVDEVRKLYPPAFGDTVAQRLDETLRVLRDCLRPEGAAVDWATRPGGQMQQPKGYLDFIMANGKVDDTDFRFADVLHQELCLQREAEKRWASLVAQMAPNCLPPGEVFGDGPTPGHLIGLIDRAMHRIAQQAPSGNVPNALRTDCGLDGPDIPAHFETSLASLVKDRASNGGQ